MDSQENSQESSQFSATANVVPKEEPMDTTAGNSAALLYSVEDISGRASPDLWPEQVPGFSNFTCRTMTSTPPVLKDSPVQKLVYEMTNEDVAMMHELGQHSADKLIQQVRDLQNLAYQLGLEEAKQLTRGRILKVLENQSETPAKWAQ